MSSDISSPSNDSSSNSDANCKTNSSDTSYECNICLETANDAVVSMCGHLFCWPCLHQWLEVRRNCQTCPVCKSGISKNKVIPIYGHGSCDQKDPREKTVPRPPGQTSQPEFTGFHPIFGFANNLGFQFSFGIGSFPFGFIASMFNLNDGRSGPPAQGTPQEAEEHFLSKIFLWLGIILLFWLWIA